MAIGSARLLGFKLAPNFNNPYLKTNPQDFWNAWHMSLTRFAQRNVFVPMGGMRARTQYAAIVATMMVIALWHGLSIPLVIFGLYHSAGLVSHRVWVSRHPVPSPRPLLRRIGANVVFLIYFLISLPLLELHLSQLGTFYERLLP
jgi:D-alanyl-lipoteichoic acid acyltransferase DltB (MBOAT superfamily)